MTDVYTIGDFRCILTASGTCSIVSAIKISDSIPIFLTKNGERYPVQGISDQFLSTCLATGMIIPDTVHEIIPGHISFYAPSDWTRLKNSLTIPKSITTIHPEAFSNFTSFVSLCFEEGSQLITLDGFRRCSSLSTVELPPSLEVIANTCFFNCKRLRNLNLATCLRLREIYGFQRCYSLGLITIPASVEIIGRTAFENCSRLTRCTSEWGVYEDHCSDSSDDEITYDPLSIEFAEDGHLREISGFNDCLVTKLTIPDSVLVINGFNGRTSWSNQTSCLGVDEVHFGQNSKLLVINGFSPPCMTTIHFPDSLEIIGDSTFNGSSFDDRHYFIHCTRRLFHTLYQKVLPFARLNLGLIVISENFVVSADVIFYQEYIFLIVLHVLVQKLSCLVMQVFMERTNKSSLSI
jgi:hypothetical protein